MANIEYQLLFGGSEKPIHLMNSQERKDAANKILNRAKEKAFSRGLPIYYSENEQLIAEYADGHKEIIKK